jgi:hypothetical protein
MIPTDHGNIWITTVGVGLWGWAGIFEVFMPSLWSLFYTCVTDRYAPDKCYSEGPGSSPSQAAYCEEVETVLGKVYAQTFQHSPV